MAKHEITTSAEIAATPERVWSILLDFAAYPKWNPFIRTISGAPLLGNRLAVQIQPGGQSAMTFRPTVLQVTEAQQLRWMGRLGVPGLFDGEHVFSVSPLDDGKTQFIQSERFSGLLAGMIFPSMMIATTAGFEAMNQALKQRAEAGDFIDGDQ